MISPETRERIRAASDIVDIIGGYIPLKKAGGTFKALCPFHKEKTPSFNVNPQRQIFHCFGCGKGGDVFAFIMEYEKIGFMDVLRRLADRAKIPLELDQNPMAEQTRHLKDQLLEIHEQITQRWQNALENEAAGQVARDYLAKRGVSAEAVKLFRLGAAPDVWDDTVNWAKSKGHDLALMDKAGLVVKKEGGDHYYDRFKGRLMFPIADEQGRVIGFSGRVLSADVKTGKYVNSPETAIFFKSKVFFGLHKSKRALLDADMAVVCEGQLDLIACFMAGVENVVAPLGTAFTEQHAHILKRYVKEVVMCFDSDEAGQKAAVRSLDHLLAAGLAVRVAMVPAPDDPDSFIKSRGGEAFQQLINNAEEFFDYFLSRLCAQNDVASDKGRLAILHEMATAVRKTGSAVLEDTYAQKTALRLGVSPEAVRAEFKKIAKAKPAMAPAADTREEIFDEETSFEDLEITRPSNDEISLLKLLLEYDEHVSRVFEHLNPIWINHEQVRNIILHRLSSHANNSWKGVAVFLSELGDPNASALVTDAITRPFVPNVDGFKVLPPKNFVPTEVTQVKDLFGIIKRLRDNFLDSKIEEIFQQLSQPGISNHKEIELLRSQKGLRDQKRSPLAPIGG